MFWNRIANTAGWQLDWRAVRGATNDHACRAASDQRDFGPLREMFDQIVTKATQRRERDATWRDAERARLAFPTSAAEPGVESGKTGAKEPPSLEQRLDEKLHELREQRRTTPPSAEPRGDRGDDGDPDRGGRGRGIGGR